MGTGNSSLGSRQSRNRVIGRRPKLLSSLLCGGSASRSTIEIEDCSVENLLNSTERCHPIIDVVRNSSRGSSLISSHNNETGTSSAGCISVIEENSRVEDGNGNFERSDHGKCLVKSKELVYPHRQVSTDSGHHESYRYRNSTTSTSASIREQESSDLSLNISANENAVNGIGHSANRRVSQIPFEGIEDSHFDVMGEETTIRDSQSDSSTHVSDPPATFDSSGDEAIRGAMPEGLGFIVSDREQDRVDGNVVHVDLVGVSSSNILSNGNSDVSNRETRRNGRRLFWDTFSRRSSRSLISNSQTIIFSTSHDSDDLASQDRWLLDFSGDFFDDGIGGDSSYLERRIHTLNEQRRQSRSEIWERLRGGLDENGRRTTLCPSGLHPNGTCSCDSYSMSEESNTRAISRIVMLAEALFEVLDEIHRQPVSLSLSMVSVPAPESIVNSFPVRNHKKREKAESGDDIEQCYICLAEYEEGDKIRVLPCRHEYHMSCVDKWLKEIHGVCPLCRGDVRQGAAESESSNSEIPSMV